MNDTALRLSSMIRKEFIQIFRDARTLVIIVLIPIMQLFLLGFSATTDVKNVQLAIWDQSRTSQSRALIDAFRSANYFTIAFDVGSQKDIQDLIEHLAVLGRGDDDRTKLIRIFGHRLDHRRHFDGFRPCSYDTHNLEHSYPTSPQHKL